jgi:hypothetical protein
MTAPSNLTTDAMIEDEGAHGPDRDRGEEYEGMYGQELSEGLVGIGFDKADRVGDAMVVRCGGCEMRSVEDAETCPDPQSVSWTNVIRLHKKAYFHNS